MLTKNELIVLYGMRTLDYEKDPNPEHWRTISGAKVHLDNNGEIDGGAGGNFNGNYWDGKKGQQHVVGPHTMMKKNIGSGATNVMLAAGGFLGNALGKTGKTPAKEPPKQPAKQPPKKEEKFVFPKILPKTEPVNYKDPYPSADERIKRVMENFRRYGENGNGIRISLESIERMTGVPVDELLTPKTTEDIAAQFGSAFSRANNDRGKPFGNTDVKKFKEALETFKNADPNDREIVLTGINLKTLGKNPTATYKEWLKAAEELKRRGQKYKKEANSKEFGITNLPPCYDQKKEIDSNDAAIKYINGLPNPNAETKDLYSNMGSVAKSVNANIEISHSGTDGYIKPVWFGQRYVGEIQYPILTKFAEGTWGYKESMCTYLHENMHTIDYMLGGKQYGGTKSFSLHSPEGSNLASVVDKYIDNGGKPGTDMATPGKEVMDFIADYRKAQSDARSKAREEWEKEHGEENRAAQKQINDLWKDAIRGKISFDKYRSEKRRLEKAFSFDSSTMKLDEKYDGTGNLMDIYDALANGAFHDHGCQGRLFAGHGYKYYGGSRENRNTELMANWGVLKMNNPKLVEMFRKDKPDVADALDKLEASMLQKAKGLKAS